MCIAKNAESDVAQLKETSKKTIFQTVVNIDLFGIVE